MNKTYSILLLLILSPFFWSNLFWPQKAIFEYRRLPQYLSIQKERLFSEEKTKPLDDMRWYSQNHQLGRFYFNKLFIIPDELFYGLKSVSPHQIFTPSNELESISFTLFPIFFFGLYLSVLHRRFKYIILLLLSALIPVLTGQPTIYYLLPTAVLYLLLINWGLSSLKPSVSKFVLVILLAHNLLIFGRHFLL